MKACSLVVLLIFTLNGHVLAQSIEAEFKDLRQLNQLKTKKMKEKIKAQFKSMIRQEKKIRWQQIASSEPFYFYLKKGTPIVELQTEKKLRLAKDIYALGLRKPDHNDFIYMMNEDGLVYYKVKAIHTVSIDPELEMFTPPKKYVKYTPEQKIKREALAHEVVLGIHYDNYRAVFTSDIFDNPSLSNGSGTRFSTDYYFNFNSPISVGLVGEFENARFQSSSGDEKVTKSALSFGAALRFKEITALPLSPRFWAKVTYALSSQMSYQSSSGTQEEDFNQTAAELGVETNFKLPLGALKLGLSFRRQWLKNIGDDRNIRYSGRAAYDDSFGMFLAWGTSWLD